MRRLMTILAMVAGSVFLFGPAALAQTTTTADPYPGGTTTTVPQPTESTIDITILAGATVSVDACGFLPGTTLSLTLNGGPVFLTQPADTNGCLHVTIQAVNGGSALRTPILAVAGLHNMQLAETGSTVIINGVTLTATPPGQVNILNVSGTGANGAPRVVHIRFTVVVNSSSGLSRTGAMILRWTLVAIGLIAAGALLVLVDRRRGRALTR